MSNTCLDGYNTTFSSFENMMQYHAALTGESQWERWAVNKLFVAPLEESSPLFADISRFAIQVSQEAIEDTSKNLALALKVNGVYIPLRETAWKSLLDRAKIGGTALPKLSLVGVLTRNRQTDAPDSVKADLAEFCTAMQREDVDLKSMGVLGNKAELLDRIMSAYSD